MPNLIMSNQGLAQIKIDVHKLKFDIAPKAENLIKVIT